MVSYPRAAIEPVTQRTGIRLHGAFARKFESDRSSLSANMGTDHNRLNRRVLGLVVALMQVLALPGAGHTQETVANWAASANDRYLVFPNQSYGCFSGVSLKLDVWQARIKNPVPTVVYYHEENGSK